MKEEILNLFCDPEKWSGMKIECIAIKYDLDAETVKDIVESDECIDAEILRKWRYHLAFLNEAFGTDGIAKKFGIPAARVSRILREEGL